MWNRIFPYDIETYPNVFTCGIVNAETGTRWIYEVSDRHNHSRDLVAMMYRLRDARCRMLGFNNEAFDYPVLHRVVELVNQYGTATAEQIFEKAEAIIQSDWRDWSHNVWESDRVVGQIDLFKIMHFDNLARSTSLKKLEMNMRSSSIEDLPYPPGFALEPYQIPVLIDYMCWDIGETFKFARKIEGQIAFRDDISEREGRDFTNYNDTKIGKQYFIGALESAGVQCFEKVSGRKMPIQTTRDDGIVVADKLLPIGFRSPDLQRVYEMFRQSVIPPSETKGFFKDIHATVDGFQFDFGAGGIHGSVSKKTFRTSKTHDIVDVDVTSYYPSLAIANGWYPEHLGKEFCSIYTRLKDERVSYAKGTAQNAMLKLALNGVYGDSNNKYSPFYDPAYTMAITINGQLLLAALAEYVMTIPDLTLIQINTDGLTVLIPKTERDTLSRMCREWEDMTRLQLESVDYKAMFVRDVNNYVAIDLKDKVKAKNAYMTDPDWHQDHSSLVVPKAVQAHLVDGTDPTDFIFQHTDPFDFMRHVKVPRSSRLEWGEKTVQNTTRYHIALQGDPLTKVMPPLAGKDVERRIGVDVGWKVVVCNRVEDFDWNNLNRRWYVVEAEKLIKGVGL